MLFNDEAFAQIPGQMAMESAARQFDVIPGRRWTKVAEVIGGQRSAIWFQDTQTGRWYAAESWKRPNLRHPLNDEQAAFVESVLR
jgi:hypothetical protein